MKKIILSIILLSPIFLLAQNDSNKTFKFAPITQNEDGSNKEFYANYKQGIAFYNKAVDIINKTEPKDKVGTIDKLQDEAKEHCKEPCAKSAGRLIMLFTTQKVSFV